MNNLIFLIRDGVFLGILFLLSYLDLSIRKVPDRALLCAIINWMLAALLLPSTVRSMALSLAAGLLFDLGLLLITLIVEVLLKKKCLGGGDIKLLFVICLYLGFWHTLYALAIACGLALLSLLFSQNKGPFPFAPAITAGTSIVMCIWKL